MSCEGSTERPLHSHLHHHANFTGSSSEGKTVAEQLHMQLCIYFFAWQWEAGRDWDRQGGVGGVGVDFDHGPGAKQSQRAPVLSKKKNRSLQPKGYFMTHWAKGRGFESQSGRTSAHVCPSLIKSPI